MAGSSRAGAEAPNQAAETFTFLLTDVEGSTRLWQDEASVMDAAMSRHHEIFHEVVQRHGGMLPVDQGEGDGRFAAFPSAVSAVGAAAEFQRRLDEQDWPTSAPLRVRAGVHSGEATVRNGNFFGESVARCARVRGLAHGGQTLVSHATYELVRDKPPDGARLDDMGEHRLKDLRRPERIWQLTIAGLRETFPALESLDAHPHNLPVEPSELIGRRQELAQLRELIDADARLVTLTGPGGIGKTRLALHAAGELVGELPGGIWFVQLAEATDEASAWSAIARALGLTDADTHDLADAVTAHLADRQQVLVLDNAEHIVEQVAAVASRLLDTGPAVSVLVTSREPLRLRAEQVFDVGPLDVPDAPITSDDAPTAEELTQFAAVRLFVDRAVASDQAFAVTNDTAPAVAEICAAVDGLPLAIELAAARVRTLSPPDILERLDHTINRAARGARDAPRRHHTVNAAIQWSHELLDDEEREAFAQLAVFRGGFTLEAAEAVVDQSLDALSAVGSLVDKSLVRRIESDLGPGESRYAMLEPIRGFAQAELDASDAATNVRQRHLGYFRDLTLEADRGAVGPHAAAWQRRLGDDYENIVAALRWGSSREDPDATRIAICVAGFWQTCGPIADGVHWLETTLRGASDVALRGRALLAAGHLRGLHGDVDRAVEHFKAAQAAFRGIGDLRGIGRSLGNLALVAARSGRRDEACRLFEESVPILDEAGDRTGATTSLMNLATLNGEAGRIEAAIEQLTLARSRFKEDDNPEAGAVAAANLARQLRVLGRLSEARDLLLEALETLEPMSALHAARTRLEVARISRATGHLDEAEAHAREAVEACRRLGASRDEADALMCLAMISASRGAVADAASTLTDAAGLFEATGDLESAAYSRVHLGELAIRRADWDSAAQHLVPAVEVLRSAGLTGALAAALLDLALVDAHLGRRSDAATVTESRDLIEAIGDADLRASAELTAAVVARLQGAAKEAIDHAVAAVAGFAALGNKTRAADAARELARCVVGVRASEDAAATAARLLGYADAADEQVGQRRTPEEVAATTPTIEAARAVLGGRFEAELAAGSNTSAQDIVALAASAAGPNDTLAGGR